MTFRLAPTDRSNLWMTLRATTGIYRETVPKESR